MPPRGLTRWIALAAGGALLFLGGCMAGRLTAASEKTLMHVFAYTPLEGSTPQDYEAFKKATAEMVGQIPGLKRIWVGKLREPLPIETRIHTYGVAMEFDNVQALDTYAKDPAHDQWVKLYEKVRKQGTTTLDILGE